MDTLDKNDYRRIINDAIDIDISDKKIEIDYFLQMDTMTDYLIQASIDFKSEINQELFNLLNRISNNAILVNIILISVFLLLMLIFWKLFVLNFESRIVNAKLVLKIFPHYVLSINERVKEFLNKSSKDIIIR